MTGRTHSEWLLHGATLSIDPDQASLDDIARLATELMETRAAILHVLRVLPEPVWNEHRVLVWSLLDIQKLQEALA